MTIALRRRSKRTSFLLFILRFPFLDEGKLLLSNYFRRVGVCRPIDNEI
jgi:hypothetical protein